MASKSFEDMNLEEMKKKFGKIPSAYIQKPGDVLTMKSWDTYYKLKPKLQMKVLLLYLLGNRHRTTGRQLAIKYVDMFEPRDLRPSRIPWHENESKREEARNKLIKIINQYLKNLPLQDEENQDVDDEISTW